VKLGAGRDGAGHQEGYIMRVTKKQYLLDKERIRRIISITKYYPSGVLRGHIQANSTWGREKYGELLTKYAERVYKYYISQGIVKYSGYTQAHKDFYENAIENYLAEKHLQEG
jgi:hypothetical protein